MRLNRNSAVDDEHVSVDGVVRTHWVLAVCVVCGHEQPRGEHAHGTCPGCGALLRSFALYRDLRASS